MFSNELRPGRDAAAQSVIVAASRTYSSAKNGSSWDRPWTSNTAMPAS